MGVWGGQGLCTVHVDEVRTQVSWESTKLPRPGLLFLADSVFGELTVEFRQLLSFP